MTVASGGELHRCPGMPPTVDVARQCAARPWRLGFGASVRGGGAGARTSVEVDASVDVVFCPWCGVDLPGCGEAGGC